MDSNYNRARAALAALAAAVLAACGGGDAPPEDEGPSIELVEMDRTYKFQSYRGHQSIPDNDPDPITVEGTGELLRFQDFGGLYYNIPGTDSRARQEVFSNAGGSTYWVYATAPADDGTPAPLTGTEVYFEQEQVFRKLRDNAKLTYEITHATVHVSDYNTSPPDESDCPYEIVYKEVEELVPLYDSYGNRYEVKNHFTLPDYVRTYCDNAIRASLSFTITGRHNFKYLGGTDGTVTLYGRQGKWEWYFDDDFSGLEEERWQVNTFGGSPTYPTYAIGLLKPDQHIRLPMDLTDVPIDGLIRVTSKVRATTGNHRLGESGAFATFKDPVTGASGPRVEYEGLELVSAPPEPNAPPVERPTPACSNAAGQAGGSIAFEHAQFDALEQPGPGARITLVRTDGAAGQASVQVDTVDGSAKAGADYEAVHRRVHFGDGQLRRTVWVPMTQDGVQEDLKSLTLRLSAPLGCATLGAQAEATLTLHDDDHPLPPKERYTVGGTVSGLLGTGLVLRDKWQFTEVAVDGNGAFVMPLPYQPGLPYELTVAASPSAPVQTCRVRHETAGGNVWANVDNIVVECDPPSLPGSLDAGFGTLGKVAQGLVGGARTIARQSTGHIIAAHGTRMVRYGPDGRLDTTFGGGLGYVDGLLPLLGGEVFDLAVGADDRIVVAGRVLQPAKSPPFYQIAAARFEADGRRDLAFGGQGTGVATVRLGGIAEDARRVLVQPDGRVLLVGHATLNDGPVTSPANVNTAVVRLAADGTPDASFGGFGAVLGDLLPQDFAQAALLQPDGGVVIGGMTRQDSGESFDSLYGRVSAAGVPEPGFGRVPPYSTLDDEVVDMALQPDGKIVLLVAGKGIHYEVMLARLQPDGNPDLGFGDQGKVRADPGPHDDLPRAIAIQADGRIVVAAQLSNPLPVAPSFGLLRFEADGQPDARFGTGGVLRVPFFGGNDSANDLLVQPDGRIVAAGLARSGLTGDIAMVRIVP
jgi:uncharacterized delta-60 repeat protein